MELVSGSKYKDELPINTINRIRNILTRLGLLTVETGWQNSAQGFYSINLNIANTDLGTNGKGTTQEYALASAYGELMERLQNQSFFRLNNDLSKKSLEYKGFYYGPDEKNLSLDDLMASKEDWIREQMDKVDPTIDKRELLEKWKAVSYEDTPSDFIGLPYLNVINNKISYIPIKMISKMYMSNGMCGGNTVEEALVQGLCEVFERYVNKKIIKDKITPPTISHTYLEQFPRIYNMICEIKAKGNYEVIVKDCSLEEGYPVIGVIYINKDDQTYFIKFGAHPVFEIALERTLTELLQGQDIRNMRGVTEYTYKTEIKEEEENIIGIFVDGSGLYPSQIFNGDFTYEFKGFKDHNLWSNKEMLTYLINLLRDKGHNVYIRDVSFLGFPSFHIIVPGFSEIYEIDNIRAIDDYGNYNKIKRYIRNLENISQEEMKELMDFFKNTNYNREASITQLLNLPVKNIFPWYYVKIHLFIAGLYYKNGDYVKAHKAMGTYVNNMEKNIYNNMEMTYYKCARDYIGTRIDDLNEEDAINRLSTFYPVPIIHGVIADFGNREEILRKYGEIECWNCKECKLRTHCSYGEMEKVYRKLKDKYEENPIDQNGLKEKLNKY
ncbi:MAG: YcaO-like family protein [Anaeromicrobium sp.]|uniref:YcaO-like family protein n=1 Tax=Anaeromicrobium sp. TaxID=1929132 RepID=UPI0025D9A4E2|nr:YcaO-like family protein [Anaeromicrobium sp.]MCT4595895.1 YcaO-like family protein [Anaeromicrobium sp.]